MYQYFFTTLYALRNIAALYLGSADKVDLNYHGAYNQAYMFTTTA